MFIEFEVKIKNINYASRLIYNIVKFVTEYDYFNSYLNTKHNFHIPLDLEPECNRKKTKYTTAHIKY